MGGSIFSVFLTALDVQKKKKARDIRVSPSGDEWSALSPEGVHVFRRDPDLVLDAPGLNIADTPESVALALKNGEPTRALAVALGLEAGVVPLVLRAISQSHIPLVARALPLPYVGRLLASLAAQLAGDARDVHLYLLWTRHLVGAHGKVLVAHYARFREPLLALQRALHKKTTSLAQVCAANTAMMRYLVEAPAPKDDGEGPMDLDAEAQQQPGSDEDADAIVKELGGGEDLAGWGEDWAGAGEAHEAKKEEPSPSSQQRARKKKRSAK